MPIPPMAAALQRFVFRSKVKIEVAPGSARQRFLYAAAMAQGSALGGDDRGGARSNCSRAGPRSLRISRASTADTAGAARWQAFDLEHGLPRLPASQAGHWTPQQLSLERLQAFSVKKGCYPGQEIVARTHFLGQAKRGLALLEATPRWYAGRDLTCTGGGAVRWASGMRWRCCRWRETVDDMIACASCRCAAARA